MFGRSRAAWLLLGVFVSLPALGMEDVEACLPYPQDKLLKAECGSCHLAYPPALLPARSWRRMMGELEHHFDTDASLEAGVRDAILVHLLEYAADGPNATCRMEQVEHSLPRSRTPLRITETPYFRKLHRALKAKTWKDPQIKTPANCGACHPYAEQGRFASADVRVPGVAAKRFGKHCKGGMSDGGCAH